MTPKMSFRNVRKTFDIAGRTAFTALEGLNLASGTASSSPSSDDQSVEITTAFLNAPTEATDKVARSPKMLTSKELDAFTKDGTVNKWRTDFNRMFQEFGTVKEPLAPEKFYTGELFVSAR
jgi:hypothetical protein